MSSKSQSAVRLVAEKYAKALSSSVKSEAEWLEIKKNANNFLDIVGGMPELRVFLKAKNFSVKQKSAVLSEIAEKEGFCESFKNFIKLICENNRSANLKEIFSALDKEILRKDGKTPVLIITASPISDGEKDNILSALKKRIKGELVVKTQIDPELLGGFYMRTDQIAADASVKTQIKKLLQSVREGTGYDDSSV